VSVKVRNLCASYGQHQVLKNVSFDASPGECIAVLGPNGVGKTTLFRCLLGLRTPSSGSISIDGKIMEKYNSAQLAHAIAYIPQNASPVYNYTVLDMVLMGVTHSLPRFRGPAEAHTEKALEILKNLGIMHLEERGCNEISGGERQLVLLARALIQDARVLIMDEPTANLDYANRFWVMKRIQMLGSSGYTVIFSTHEPNHALAYASRVLALKNGEVLLNGNPRTVLTEDALSSLYGIGIHVGEIELADRKHLVSIPFEKEDT